MARRSRARSRAPDRRFRRTKIFIVSNAILWVAIGVWYVVQPVERRADVERLVGNAFDSRKDVSAFDVAWDLWQLYAHDTRVAVALAGDREYFPAGMPRTQRPVRVLVNRGYVVGYDESLGNPLWVAYRSFDVDTLDAGERPDSFRADLRSTARIEPAAYSRSGYDRGHMAPSYVIATRFGREAQDETFLMTNIVPQRHALNAGPWKMLEHRIATNLPARFGEVWVMVGPVFEKRPRTLERRVAVPAAFYLILLDEIEGKVRSLAFLLPQDATGQGPLAEYLVSIDEIETRTGLDFMPDLEDGAEEVLESARAARVW